LAYFFYISIDLHIQREISIFNHLGIHYLYVLEELS